MSVGAFMFVSVCVVCFQVQVREFSICDVRCSGVWFVAFLALGQGSLFVKHAASSSTTSEAMTEPWTEEFANLVRGSKPTVSSLLNLWRGSNLRLCFTSA